MIHSVKDLSPDQKLAIESLLGRPISEGEQVSVRTVPASPEWLMSIQQDPRKNGTDKLTMEEIDAEIAAARRERDQRSRTMIRVVIDTNILVSALLTSGGLPEAVIDLAVSARCSGSPRRFWPNRKKSETSPARNPFCQPLTQSPYSTPLILRGARMFFDSNFLR